MMNLRPVFILVSVFASILALPVAQVVAAPKNVTPAERAMLPDYCNHTQNYESIANPSPKAKYWLSKLGDDLWHIHHYCNSHVHWMRTQKHGMKKHEVDFELSQVINEIRYMLLNAAPTFVLRPEMNHRSGQAALRLKQYTDARMFFENAIKDKNDYWPSYIELADLYLLQDNVAAAKQVMQLADQILPQDHPRVIKLKKDLKL
jgi:tetratricopeptide (TPR) repeat protein